MGAGCRDGRDRQGGPVPPDRRQRRRPRLRRSMAGMRVGGPGDLGDAISGEGGQRSAAAARARPASPKSREYSAIPSAWRWRCAKARLPGSAGSGPTGSRRSRSDLNMRVYTRHRRPDARSEDRGGRGRGRGAGLSRTAYVVLEDLELAQFGNRVPQFSFEVMRPAHGELPGHASRASDAVRAVALIPGTGEYALATTPVHYEYGPGARAARPTSIRPAGRPISRRRLRRVGGRAAQLRCGVTGGVVVRR